MVDEIKAFRCSCCGDIFQDLARARACENSHVLADNLEFNAALYQKDLDIYENQEYKKKFPTSILVSIKSHSGIAAVYRLRNVGSVEDFSEEFFENYWRPSWG